MTSERAQAYGRVMAALEEASEGALQPGEAGRVREAADTLLFSEGGDQGAAAAVADVTALTRALVESDRWSEAAARRLLDDLLHCGELAVVA